jgi:hypothetical protein
MSADAGEKNGSITIHSLRRQLSPYAKSNTRQAIIQLITTFIPYLACWALLIYMVDHHYPVLGYLSGILTFTPFAF